ncbi:NAD(P)/FAD-dependent oxidoreductase [Marinomonas algicola]|uniref:NAD(P)/FAD-dependent oxidoreductase n=1 Tax=Marinomonas algicola TaxID=2773454 RepID=UPI00174E934B|nr:FAD-dependent oxidoreductase [Marinomonas algicola]
MLKKQTPSYLETDIAIIGAGIAGAFCASLLTTAGKQVTLVEKSRGTGGRSSSKRLADNLGCDLGAPFFHITNPTLKPQVQQWLQDKVVAEWSEANKDGFQAYVGIPKMSAITRYLMGKANLINSCRVHQIEKTSRGWLLRNEQYQPILVCRQLIITAPAAQTCALLASPHTPDSLLIESHKASALCRPQWSAMITTKPQANHLEAVKVLPLIEPDNHPIIERIIYDSAKPKRSDDTSNWVVQARRDWSENHVDADKNVISEQLSNAFFEITGQQGNPMLCQRWLLGRHSPIAGDASRWIEEQQIGLAADWLCQGDIEGALLSAKDLCERICALH